MILSTITLQIIQQIIDLWWSAPMTALAFIVVYFLMNPDKVEKWSSIFARLFASVSRKSERHTVSADIQSRISQYVKTNDINDILPFGLKFKWVEGENSSSYLEGEDVVIIMDYHKNNAKNFVTAIQEWTSKSLLPEARNEIPSPIMIATELLMQEKIIYSQRPDALEFFKDEVLPVKITDDVQMNKFRERFKFLDQSEYFEIIFLSELSFAGARLRGMEQSKKYSEFENFLNLLEWILKREQEDESKPLQFSGEVFKVWIILVAKEFRLRTGDSSPYLKRTKESISKKYDSVYVTGRGQNIKFTQDVIDDIKSEDITTLKWIKEIKTRDRNNKKKHTKIALFRN